MIYILCFSPINLLGQNVTLRGTVSDSTTTAPMIDANILAFPKNDGERIQFAITNDKSEYVLRLEKEVAYSIEVSYLGYQKLSFDYTAIQDEIKDLLTDKDI